MIWLFLVFLAPGHSIYQEFYSQDLNCSGRPTVKYASNLACGEEGFEPGCTNFLGLIGYTTTCPEIVVLPPNWASIQVWAGTTTCSGQPDFAIALPPNTCSGYWLGPTIQVDCLTSSIRQCLDSAPDCSQCPSSPADTRGLCTSGNLITNFSSASYILTCPRPCQSHETGIVESGVPSRTWFLSPSVLVGLFLALLF